MGAKGGRDEEERSRQVNNISAWRDVHIAKQREIYRYQHAFQDWMDMGWIRNVTSYEV